eukprot:scaffold282356_cov31-Tisochrysis_lutea.AAC.2
MCSAGAPPFANLCPRGVLMTPVFASDDVAMRAAPKGKAESYTSSAVKPLSRAITVGPGVARAARTANTEPS